MTIYAVKIAPYRCSALRFVTQSIGAGKRKQDDVTEPSDCVRTDSAASGTEGDWETVNAGTAISWYP